MIVSAGSALMNPLKIFIFYCIRLFVSTLMLILQLRFSIYAIVTKSLISSHPRTYLFYSFWLTCFYKSKSENKYCHIIASIVVFKISLNYNNPATIYGSTCTKPGKWAVMYLCARGIWYLILELFQQCGILYCSFDWFY